MRGSSSLTESHLLRVNIGFHTLNLIAKFSCDIVLTLKTSENKVICQTVARPLIQGICEINQQLQLQWQSAYDVGKSEYLQTSMEITVLVNSINGTIQAGLCVVDVTRMMNKSNIPLKKCSDKSASICITNSFEFLQVIQEKDFLELSKESFPSNGSFNHNLKKMKSVQYLHKNQESNLSISKITVSNKRLEGYLRGENEQLQRQNEILQGKVKLIQRKQKELLQQFRQCLSKYDKLNIRYLQQTSNFEGSQSALEQKQRMIKMLQSELKMKQYKLKQMGEQELNNEKKSEAKEQSYQQQIKRLTQKIINLQSQLHQTTQYQNGLLAKYELIQKNCQIIIKEKQKAQTQEKNKLLKDINQRQKQNQNNLKEIKELKEKIAEIQFLHNKQKEGIDFQKILEEKNKQMQLINQKYAETKQQLKQVETQNEQLRQNNESRQFFRKRLNQVQSENNHLRIQLEKANQLIAFNEVKLKETTERYEQGERQRKKNQNKIDQLLSSNTITLNRYAKLEQQINYYKQSYQRLAEQHSQTKEKKDEIEIRLKDQLDEWTHQVQLLATERSKFQTENIDLKWEIQRFEQAKKENQSTINSYKTELFQLQQQLLLKSDKLAQYESKRSDLDQTIARLAADLQISENRVKDLLKSNAEKVTIISVSNKEKQKLLEQIQLIKRQHEGMIKGIKQSIQNELELKNIQKDLEAKSIQKQKLQEELANKQVEIEALRYKLQQAHQGLQGILAENQQLSDENIKYSCDLTHKTTEIKLLKETGLQREKELSQLKQSLTKLQGQYDELTAIFNDYRQRNGDAVRWVLCILGEEELIIEQQTVFFPEDNLRQLQVEAIKNRNLFLGKLKKTMRAAIEQKQFLAFELEKIGQQLIDSSNDYQQLLEKERAQRQTSIKEFVSERRLLIAQIQRQKIVIEQLKMSNDNFFKQNRLLQHQVNELEEDKAALTSEKQDLSERILQIQQQTSQKSQKLIFSQKQIEQKQLLLAEERKIFAIEQEKQKKRLLQQIFVLQSRIKQRQHEMQVKIDKIKQLQEKNIVLESQKRKIEFALSVLEQLSKNNQVILEQSLRQKGELLSKIESLEIQIDKRQKNIHAKEVQIAQWINSSGEMQQKYLEILAKYEALKELNAKTQGELAIKLQEYKESRQKSKQAEDVFNRMKQNLQKEINHLRSEIDISKMVNEKTAEELNEKSKQLEYLHEEIQSKREYIIKLQSDNEMIHKEVFFEQSHKDSLERQFQILSQNYEHAKSDIYHLEEEKLKLEKEIDNLNEIIQQKQKKIQREIQNSRIRVARQASDLKKRIELQETKVHKLESKCEEFKYYIKQIQSASEKRQFLLLASEQQKQKLRSDFEDEIDRLNKQIQKLHDRSEETITDYREQREQLMRQIQHLSQQCMKKQEQLQDNHKEHDSSLRKIALLQSEIKQLQSEQKIKSKDVESMGMILDQMDEKQKDSKDNSFHLPLKQYLEQ